MGLLGVLRGWRGLSEPSFDRRCLTKPGKDWFEQIDSDMHHLMSAEFMFG